MHSIGCLSQKGGVGKSTLATLIATIYAGARWRSVLVDLNTKQKSSSDWAAIRAERHLDPPVPAFATTDVAKTMRELDGVDLIVFDGKPDSDRTSLEIARISDLVIVPAGVSLFDLKPQVLFAQELLASGIEKRRVLFVLIKSVDSDLVLADARGFIEASGFEIAKTDIPLRAGYQLAQNQGQAISETTFPTLNDRALALAGEIVEKFDLLTRPVVKEKRA